MARKRPAQVPASRGTVFGIRIALAFLVGWYACAGPAVAQPRDPTAAASDPITLARRSFEDARFGLFIHWGVYSLLGKGEWVMDRDKLPITQYAKLPPLFNPARFDAPGWARLARSAGAKYITITAKHHDGFCMFASELTSYDVVDATPFHADPLKALADACKRENIKLFFYYSLLDWHHPDYFPTGKTGHAAGRLVPGDFKQYVAFYQGQIRELCTNYGPLGGIWFDGWWDKPDAEWDLAGTYRLIHELQPCALIGNNHHVAPFPGEDFQMFEQDLPGENGAGFNKAGPAAGLPLETCLTINQSWGHNARDTHFKPAKELIHALAGAAGRGANLLLNVGPRPDGTIGPEFTERLLEIGKWLNVYGETIYGTRRGPIPPQPWGVSTARGSPEHPTKIYLHILKLNDKASIVFDPNFSWTPYLFGKPEPLKLKTTAKGLVLDPPREETMPFDTIIALLPRVTGR